MKQRNRISSTQGGSAYIIVLLVLLLLTIFGLSLVVITHTERQIGSNEREATRNFFVAESGIAVAVAWLQEGSTDPHSLVVRSRTAGGTAATAKALAGSQTVFRDTVQTTQLVVAGSQFSNLGDVSSNAGKELRRSNFRFETNARRVSTSSSGVLAGREIQLGQKRIELMIEMDPFEVGGSNLYTGALEYAAEETPETLAPGN